MKMEVKKRATALKLSISQIVLSSDVLRVNLIANVIEKFEVNNEKKFGSITLDDGTGQIRAKVFGDDLTKIKDIKEGDTILVIGLIKEYNNEKYLVPEIIRTVNPRVLFLRNLEIQDSSFSDIIKIKKSNNNELRNLILEKLREKDIVPIESLILEIKEFSPELVKQEIENLIKENILYEPIPSKLRIF